MSFPFPRLPFLAIREVIKSMNTGEIFFFSLLSKKSQILVMLSIPKNALSAEFIFKEKVFLFELKPKGYIEHEVDIIPVVPSISESNSLFTRFSFDGLYVNCKWTFFSEVEESIGTLFYYYSKTFKNSKIGMKFEAGTRDEFAMEMLRFAWDNGFPLDNIGFRVKNASPESIQELLNWCNGHHAIPMGFRCIPPPGGIFTTAFPNLTVEYLNDLLRKIANMECKLMSFVFKLKSIKPTDFAKIVEGLSESAIKQDGAWQGLQIERKDGLKLLVSLEGGWLELENDFFDD